MKVDLCREIIRWFDPRPKVVADPMVGTGTSLVASSLEECEYFLGCEKILKWAECSRKVYASIPFHIHSGRAEQAPVEELLRGRKIHLLVTSPPFPNAHNQGKTEAQVAFLKQKGTYAGNDFEDMSEWRNRASFIRSLTAVLRPWRAQLASTGKAAIHIKNFVRKRQEVRADQWVEEALKIMGMNVLGYLKIPLEYRSLFQESLRYPLRKVIQSTVGEGHQIDVLECKHIKHRKEALLEPTESARCVECGVMAGHVEVREERVVVAERGY